MSEQWSNWIEHKPGEPCPIPWAKAGEWQARSRTGGKGCSDAWADDCAERHQALIFVGAWEHRRDCWPVLRYRYRLDCAPAGFVPPGAEKPWYPPAPEGFSEWRPCNGVEPDQPTQEQVEATQKPETPEADASEDAKAANRPMFDADDVGVLTGTWTRYEARQAWQKPTEAPGFMVRAVRSSDGLLTVREADHRLGLWS